MNPSAIRDLLNKLQNINESTLVEASRGLLFRSPGDTFIKGNPKNPTDEMVVGDQPDYFPNPPGQGDDQYDTFEDFKAALIAAGPSYPGLSFVNQVSNSVRAFAIITFTNKATKQKMYIGKYFKSITPNMAGKWKNNEVPGGWQLNTKTSLKSSYGLKPADLLSGEQTYTLQSLASELMTIEKIEPLMDGLHELMSGRMPTFKGQKDLKSAIQDDLGEIMAPIALAKGLVKDSGAASAQQKLLGGASWSGLTVSFPFAKNNGLVDSYVYVNGVEVGISSKGKDGATASVKNVTDGVKLAREQGLPEHKKLLSRYAKEINLIERIGTESAVNFPLDYAVENGIISSGVSDTIRQLIRDAEKTVDSVPDDQLEEIESILSKFNANKSKTNYNIGYHALAYIARLVANHINESKDFGAACLIFININPIIQIYLTAEESQDDVKIVKLTSMYPPNFEGTILVDPGKNYSGTGAGGRLCVDYMSDAAAAEKLKKANNKEQKSIAALDAMYKKQKEDLVSGNFDIPDMPGATKRKKKVAEPAGGRKTR